MKLPATAHTSQPWRIHEIAYDFDLVDAWALPTHGGPNDFPRLVELLTSYDPYKSSSLPVRVLFAIRERLGGLLRLDDASAGLGARVTSLRERLPDDLHAPPDVPNDALLFTPLYRTEDEFAGEIANRTVHGVIQVGWVREGDRYRGQMAILVKPNGLFGKAYLAAIMPFRHLIVYPAVMRELERAWEAPRDERDVHPVS